MRLLDRVPRVLLLIVVIVSFSTTTSLTSAQPLKPPEKPANSLDDLPERWKIVENEEYRAPQMETHPLKGRASPNEDYGNESKYFGPDKEAKTKSSAVDETKVYTRSENDRKLSGNARKDEDEDKDDVSDNIVMPDGIVPETNFRRLLRIPRIG